MRFSSLRSQSILFLLPMAAALIASVALTARDLVKITDHLQHLGTAASDFVLAERFSLACTRSSRECVSFVDSRSSADEEEMLAERAIATGTLAQWRRAVNLGSARPSPETLRRLDGVEKRFRRVNEIADHVVALAKAGDLRAAGYALSHELAPLEESGLYREVEQLVMIEKADVTGELDALRGKVTSLGVVLLALGVLLLLVAVGTPAMLSRAVLNPLSSLTATAERVRGGDLTARAPIRSRDELGTLAEVFNRMIEERGRAESHLRNQRVRVEAEVVSRTAELRSANAALSESERRYRLLFESNPQPMWVYDRETLRFMAVNDSAVAHYGYSREEFLERRIQDIRPEEDVPQLLTTLARREPGLRYTGVWRHRTRDGSLIRVEITSHDVEFAGRPAVLVLAKDVTQNEILESQLRQAQKMEAVGQLAGGVAHDFNNLLAVMGGYSQMLSMSLPLGSKEQKQADQIHQAADRAGSVTRQLLTFSRRQAVAPSPLNLNAVLVDIHKMLHRLVRENIELVPVPAKDLGLVLADRGQIEQVLVNLAVNASDAMPFGGKLTIRTENLDVNEVDAAARPDVPPGQYVLLTVSDTGSGMDAKTQARIFEPFFTTKDVGKGTGLGLSIVYGIVRQASGSIEVYSEPSLGTSFKIYLPRVDAKLEERAVVAEEIVVGGKETVLVAEDEQLIRTMVRTILEDSGYKVLTASDGHAALQLAKEYEGPIDLLVTDVVMPELGGRRLAERMLEVRPGTRVLYVSGYTDDAILLHGVLTRNMAFLPKPFAPRNLLARVRELLDESVPRPA